MGVVRVIPTISIALNIKINQEKSNYCGVLITSTLQNRSILQNQ
jgi:hypothetical protein